jgi:hypothetical protein
MKKVSFGKMVIHSIFHDLISRNPFLEGSKASPPSLALTFVYRQCSPFLLDRKCKLTHVNTYGLGKCIAR